MTSAIETSESGRLKGGWLAEADQGTSWDSVTPVVRPPG